MSWRAGEVRAIDEVTPVALHAYLVAYGWRKGKPFGDGSDVLSLGIASVAATVAPGTTCGERRGESARPQRANKR